MIYIYIYIYTSSSFSRTDSTDFPDFLSSVPIINPPWQVLQTTCCVCTELLSVNSLNDYIRVHLCFFSCPVGWGCRIHRLHLCTAPPNECTDSKQSDGEVPVMLGRWEMRSNPSLPLLPGPLWHRMVAPERTLSMVEIELNCILMLNWIVWIRTVWLNWIAWN